MTAEPVDLLARRLARRLAHEGREWPEFCAALLAARGRRGADRAEFARLLGIPAAELADLEGGARHPTRAPARLLAVDPDPRWLDLALEAGRRSDPWGPGAPPSAAEGTVGRALVRRGLLPRPERSRHPTTHRPRTVRARPVAPGARRGAARW